MQVPGCPLQPPCAQPRAQPEIEVYAMWCVWLDLDEDRLPLGDVVQTLMQGGEHFRNFFQFIARVSEPHRSGKGLNAALWFETDALRRSSVAVKIACHALAGATPIAEMGGVHVLQYACFELLAGLQPRGYGSSMHICMALQHLLSANDVEVCPLLLQYHAPFILLRALDQPGCAELLQSLLLGCDALMPGLVPGRHLKPVSVSLLRQVPQYLRHTAWPGLVAALLEQGSRLGCPTAAGSKSAEDQSAEAPAVFEDNEPQTRYQTPAKKPRAPSPRTTTPELERARSLTPRRSSTPQCLATKVAEGTERHDIHHEFCTVAAASPSSPSPSRRSGGILFSSPRGTPTPRSTSATGCMSPRTGELDRQAGAAELLATPQRRPGSQHSENPCECDCNSQAMSTAQAQAASGEAPMSASSRSSRKDAAAAAGRRGVEVLVELLCCILDVLRRPEQQAQLQQQLQQNPFAPQWQLEPLQQEASDGTEPLRAEVRWEMFRAIFVETALVPHLFKMIKPGAVEFEAATLLHTVLQLMANPPRRYWAPAGSGRAPGCGLGGLGASADAMVVQRLLPQFLSHIHLLGEFLVQHSQGPLREVRLNGYTVQEPLGTLRVLIVQILTTLCSLAPDRALPLLQPDAFGLLAEWFLAHRCNHIFQVACSRLLISVIRHGSSELQHLVLVEHRLFEGLCEAVLEEGTNGDRWRSLQAGRLEGKADSGPEAGQHAGEGQVPAWSRRHPGGLGGIVQVLRALVESAAQAPSENAPPGLQKGTARKPAGLLGRSPLGERAGTQLCAATDAAPAAIPNAATATFGMPAWAPEKQFDIAKLLESAPAWPRVLAAVRT